MYSIPPTRGQPEPPTVSELLSPLPREELSVTTEHPLLQRLVRLAVLVLFALPSLAAAPKYNVLFIISDDLTYTAPMMLSPGPSASIARALNGEHRVTEKHWRAIGTARNRACAIRLSN